MDGISNDGTPYDATKHPNVVDPHTFFDQNGKLWMVYGLEEICVQFIRSVDLAEAKWEPKT